MKHKDNRRAWFSKMTACLLALAFTLTLALAPSAAKAQQDPMYSQYMFNHQVLNPAYVGSWGFLTSTFLYRKQWVGINGAPETGSFSFHTPSKNDRHGFGLSFITDKIGVTQTNGFTAAYAFRIHLSEHARLALGLQGSLDNYQARFGDVRTGSTIDPGTNGSDPAFTGNSVNLWLPNAGAGLFFHTKHFYAGASTPRLITHNLSNASVASTAHQSRHFFFTTGVVIGQDDAFVKFKPSILVKYSPSSPVQFDVNAHVLFADRLWVGLSYRTEDAVVFMLQAQLLQWLRMGYAFDLITSELNTYGNASHEFMLGMDLNFKKKAMVSPRYF
jgi:type IX secretion system PorP/SprF family membrane protein